MKILIYTTLLFIGISCKAQNYPLTTTETVPQGSYITDTQNQLSAFEGNWKGTWNGKTLLINLKKMVHEYDDHYKSYRDYLVGKFQVKDSSGNILFDNLNLSDSNSKIEGGKIFPSGKYVLTYVDADLCLKSGIIFIEFTNNTKSEMKFKFMEESQLIDSECFYRGKPADQRPEPLPKEIILTKQ